MSVKRIESLAPGGARTILHEVLPLDTPYVIQIFPIYCCNFKCNYCIFSIPQDKRGFISNERVMPFKLFTKVIDDMTQFPQKIRTLRFVGIGEPLLHPYLPDMVKYVADKKVANTIEILTNGFRMMPDMSSKLLDAGLTRLVISIQGTSAAKYKKTCGISIDFDMFVSNIEYFYRTKNPAAHLYIKIVDTALEGPKDVDAFYDIFGSICDTISIEHTVPIHKGVNSTEAIKSDVTQFGVAVTDVKICPQSFFHLQINPDGNVVPCYSWDYPVILGNCNNQSLLDIWHSETLKNFRMSLFDCSYRHCLECNMIKYRMFPEDKLDGHIEQLKSKYM